MTVLGSNAGITEIEVAMFDQGGYYFRIKVGPDCRIRGEVITAPEHLLSRTFDYPNRRLRVRANTESYYRA